MWPPSGLAIGSLLLLGNRAWPAVALGAFAVNLANSGVVSFSIAVAIGNTLEALAGASLARRFARGRAAFDSTRNLIRFAAIAAGASTVAASVGAVALIVTDLASRADAWPVWFTWWVGDTVGAVFVAPVIVLWARKPPLGGLGDRLVELVGMFASVVLVSQAVFGPSFTARPGYPLAFAVMPLLLWSAFRFGARETATASAMMVVVAVQGTLRGFGPFAQDAPNDSLLLLQSFVAVTTTMMLAVAAEVSRRRTVERELRTLNEQLEKRIAERTEDLVRTTDRLVEAQDIAHVGSWEWDIAADRIWWSEQLYRIYGVDPHSPIGYDTFLGRVHPEDRAAVEARVGQAMTDGLPFTFDHRIVRPDGAVRTLHAAGRVISAAGGRPVRMTGTAHDITERKEAEEARAQLIQEQAARHEAEEASRAKDHFLAILSHELRTPLNAALGWAQMLREMPPDSVSAKRALDTINRNLLTQARLVSDIVDISRITKGALAIEKAPVDLPAVIGAAIEMVREPAAARHIAIESRLDCPSIEIVGDTRRLEQVFWNLLSNGIRFGRDSGSIRLQAAADGDSVRITVDDDGPGIDPEFLPHVFEPFRQADDSPRRAHDGLGLGLAIARHLVELHGGSISAENRPGGGARFTVSLPARQGVTVGHT